MREDVVIFHLSKVSSLDSFGKFRLSSVFGFHIYLARLPKSFDFRFEKSENRGGSTHLILEMVRRLLNDQSA